jgi:UDP:flavonoid glycosyltransferase YjiC (YdhE family)
VKVAFLHSDKPRERELAESFLAGAALHGCETAAIPLGDEAEANSFDVLAMVGVKSRERFHAYRAAGHRVVLLDKGYARHHRPGARVWEYWRLAIDAHQPTAAVAAATCPSDRRDALGWEPKPWRKTGSKVVYAGSSEKYHAFHGITHPTRFARQVVTGLRKRTERGIVYRPKPSWQNATPLPKAMFSKSPETLAFLLESAWALVTHGSNACFDAVMAGVPCIVLGDAVARPISSTSLDDIESPRLATEKERAQWLANLAYWQWTEDEFASGQAWEFLKGQFDG